MQMLDHRRDECFGQVIECSPEQHDVKHAVAKGERAFEEALDVPHGTAFVICADLPVSLACIMNKICHKHAVPQAGEEIDVCGRGVSNIDDPKARLGLQ